MANEKLSPANITEYWNMVEEHRNLKAFVANLSYMKMQYVDPSKQTPLSIAFFSVHQFFQKTLLELENTMRAKGIDV